MFAVRTDVELKESLLARLAEAQRWSRHAGRCLYCREVRITVFG